MPPRLSVAAPNWVTTLNVGYGGAHASYYHRANEQVGVPRCPPRVPPVSPVVSPRRRDRRVPSQVQVGVELEANTRLQETTFAFGYQLNLPRANVVFRGGPGPLWWLLSPAVPSRWHSAVPALSPAGLLDSNWSVGGVLEKKLPPLPVTLALGAFLNHWRNRFHCGFSVTVG